MDHLSLDQMSLGRQNWTKDEKYLTQRHRVTKVDPVLRMTEPSFSLSLSLSLSLSYNPSLPPQAHSNAFALAHKN